MLQVYQVEFDYTPAKSDELALTKDQYLTALLTESDDWWIMYNLEKQQIGWTPLNFLRKVDYSIYNCDFEYAAENEDELTLKEGDTLYILDKETEIEGWFVAMIETYIGSVELLVQEHGLKYAMYKVGLVPSNFISPKTNKPKLPGAIGLPKGGTVQLKPNKPASAFVPEKDFSPPIVSHKPSFNVSPYPTEQQKTITIKKATPAYANIGSFDPKTSTIKKPTPATIQVPTINETFSRKEPTPDSAIAPSPQKYVERKESILEPKKETQKQVSDLAKETNKLSLSREKKEIAVQTGTLNPSTIEELQWYIDDQLLSIKVEMYTELDKIRKLKK